MWIWRYAYWSTVMISRCFVCVRAKRSARSFASEPELTKKHTFSVAGILATIFSAHWTISSCRKRLLVDRMAICLEAASTTFGWQWPTGFWLKIIDGQQLPICIVANIVFAGAVDIFGYKMMIWWFDDDDDLMMTMLGFWRDFEYAHVIFMILFSSRKLIGSIYSINLISTVRQRDK